MKIKMRYYPNLITDQKCCFFLNLTNLQNHMNKNSSFAYLAIMVMGIIIISCSKKDPAPSQASLLVGSWILVSTVTTSCTDATNNKSLTNCTSCATLVFTATTITTTNLGSSQGLVSNYTLNGNIITATNPVTNAPATPGTATFLVAGSTLTLTIEPTAANGNCKTVFTYG